MEITYAVEIARYFAGTDNVAEGIVMTVFDEDPGDPTFAADLALLRVERMGWDLNDAMVTAIEEA